MTTLHYIKNKPRLPFEQTDKGEARWGQIYDSLEEGYIIGYPELIENYLWNNILNKDLDLTFVGYGGEYYWGIQVWDIAFLIKALDSALKFRDNFENILQEYPIEMNDYDYLDIWSLNFDSTIQKNIEFNNENFKLWLSDLIVVFESAIAQNTSLVVMGD